jgi:hypothetical protein
MNGRLVRKTLSFSKELRLLQAASPLEDALSNCTRPRKHITRRIGKPFKTGTLAPAHPSYGCWTHRSPLERQGAFALRACSPHNQHLTGRLPARVD